MIGAKLAKLFEGMAHAIQLTVIDQREYYENHTGLLRCVADPSFQQQTSTAHHEWMEQPHKTLIVGALVEVRERTVRLALVAFIFHCSQLAHNTLSRGSKPFHALISTPTLHKHSLS